MSPTVAKVEKIRQKKGVTKTHIANYCGKSVAWYADIAKGRRQVYLDDFLKILESLELKKSIFFEDELSETHNSPQTNTA